MKPNLKLYHLKQFDKLRIKRDRYLNKQKDVIKLYGCEINNEKHVFEKYPRLKMKIKYHIDKYYELKGLE